MRAVDLLDRPIAFHRPFVALAGSITAALMLSQALYWQRRSEGWWWKTGADWMDETGMTRHELDAARKRLVDLGLLKTELRGMPAKTHYQLDLDRLSSSLLESGEPVCRKPANKNAGKRQACSPESGNSLTTETTTETTAEIPAWLDREVWDAWLRYRSKELRKPVRPPLAQRQFKLLAELKAQGNDPAQVIRQSMEAGWTGLFALKSRGRPQNDRSGFFNAVYGRDHAQHSDDGAFIHGTAERVG